ncbi:hypothetical protein [Halarsenatibacter silvermanii]|uniref:Uncharacterized protein n=1 Tax=Halarsenatibacter silvermanii TaxID=321763 RepID=A0A1G9T9S5_9FIRM|nr:hypothetical protein [Halarsenatibacter silvermanii]SDM44503.1 hypothetical protein SAMN04488692_1368 [Halarsenatibacter silvermanii]
MDTNSKQLLEDDYEISQEFLTFIDTIEENAAVLNGEGMISVKLQFPRGVIR